MIFSKWAHQSPKFQVFDCSRKISPNIYFDRLLLLKVYKISIKNVQRSYVSWYWRVMQNLKKNQFASKIIRIWWILIRTLKSLKSLHFHWSLLCKVYNLWPKKVQKSYLSWQWRVVTCSLENNVRNLANFHQSTWKSQNWDFHCNLLSKVENVWA